METSERVVNVIRSTVVSAGQVWSVQQVFRGHYVAFCQLQRVRCVDVVFFAYLPLFGVFLRVNTNDPRAGSFEKQI